MKLAFIIIAALGFLGAITYNVKKTDVKTETVEAKESATPKPLQAKEKSPVLIELFTSEGCSSCPPADKNLIEFNDKQPFEGAEVITLAMHVDYWNRLGWKDVFSAPQFSERQSFYADTFGLGEVFTPQMIVDGKLQFVGSNIDEARKAVGETVKTPKGKVALSASGDKLQVKISDLPKHSPANVFIAVAEDDLATVVKNGENGGRTLPHTSVVRELRTIGKVTAEDDTFDTETAFQLQPSWKKENVKIVVFVQVENDSRVIGVNQIKL